MIDVFSWISEELDDIRAAGLERTARCEVSVRSGSTPLLNFATNDYLGLGADRCLVPQVVSASREYGSGSGASRLLAGTLELHELLEQALAKLTQSPRATLFSSGYLANIGAVPVLAGRNDVVFCDRHAHASLVDGVLLSRARFVRFRHNDLHHLRDCLQRAASSRRRAQRFLVVVESVYSMEGDELAAADAVALAHEFDAMLLVDESHALGLFGPGGGGLLTDVGPEAEPVIRTASFGKSFASAGGFVSSNELVQRLIVNRARSFIYDTAPQPAAVGAALASIEHFHDVARRQRVFELAKKLRIGLTDAGLETIAGRSPIVPVMVPGNSACLRCRDLLLDAGILAAALRSPTVQKGRERIRFSVSAAHTNSDIERVIAVMSGFRRDGLC